jgi:hypothetical protein
MLLVEGEVVELLEPDNGTVCSLPPISSATTF